MSESKTPIDMVLYCPKCGMQHIDAPEEPVFHDYCTTPEFPAWDNPPHKSHLCHGCGHVWRPSDHPTNGVERTASGKDADTRPVDLAAARAEVERLRNELRIQDEANDILTRRLEESTAKEGLK